MYEEHLIRAYIQDAITGVSNYPTMAESSIAHALIAIAMILYNEKGDKDVKRENDKIG